MRISKFKLIGLLAIAIIGLSAGNIQERLRNVNFSGKKVTLPTISANHKGVKPLPIKTLPINEDRLMNVLDQSVCYFVSDGNDRLYKINPLTGVVTLIGPTGVPKIESLTLDSLNNILYTADSDDFGRLSLTTGAFTSIKKIGNLNGALGILDMKDIDGLAYDERLGIIWASERREVNAADNDLIFKINPITGNPILNAFGTNIDYLVINTPEHDLDDIAVSPEGELYAISNAGSTGNQRLIKINTTNGSWTDLGNYGIQDVEGMTFTSTSQLLVTTGNSGGQSNKFYSVDKTNVQTKLLWSVSPGSDVEGCACRHNTFSNGVIGNFIWFDTNKNGIQDSGENGINGVVVKLLDQNGNPVLKSGNPVTTTTNSTGYYEFSFLNSGKYMIELVYPSGHGATLRDVGSNDEKDSDINPATKRSGLIDVTGGKIRYDVDAGLVNTEICNDGFDNDGDGLVDCADPDCGGMTITNKTVSSCINHPYADVATLNVTVSWSSGSPNKKIEVKISGKTRYIDVPGGTTSPATVSFVVPADGSTNNVISTNFETFTCQTTTTYNAPAACSTDKLACSMLYICGDSKGADADAFDHGLMQYIDGINGNAILKGALSKNVSGQGLYNPNSTSTLTPYNIDTFKIILVSGTTWGSISSTLKTQLKNTTANVLLMNQDILLDLGMASAKGTLPQKIAYSNNTTQVQIYDFNNSNPHWAELIGHGDYHVSADIYLWAIANANGLKGTYFHYDKTDVLGGVPATHGARTYLGYLMDGVYWNDVTNMGAIPVPQADWFNPIKHLTLNGKLYLDQAIQKASLACAIENCSNGIDDDGDGLVDCDDPDCEATAPGSINND